MSQDDLFGKMHVVQNKARGLEEHKHAVLGGPGYICGRTPDIVHSHEGGDEPHAHPHTGPACFTIERADWLRATGRDMARTHKRFTTKPSGPQLPYEEREPTVIEVIVVGDGGASIANGATGGGEFTLARMMLAFKARPTFQVIDGGPKQATGED